MCFLSISAFAANHQLAHAIEHIESAMEATNGYVIAEHASMAKIYVDALKDKKSKEGSEPDHKHLEESIKYLDDAVKKGKDGNPEAAKQAAQDALKLLMKSEK